MLVWILNWWISLWVRVHVDVCVSVCNSTLPSQLTVAHLPLSTLFCGAASGENWGRIFTTLGFMPCVEDMRVYFGERAAFYFAWLNFYIIWLVGPAVFGSVCFFMSGRLAEKCGGGL